MGEEESVNSVAKTDSNGNITREKTLDDIGDKKDLESEGGKTLEDNEVKDLEGDDIKEREVDKKAYNEVKDLKGDDIKEMEVYKKADNEVKDLKGDDIKEMEVDKKADGEEELEVEEDKKADDDDVIIDDNKVDNGEEIKEDEKVEGEKLEEDKKVNEAEELKDDKKVNEMEDFKEDKKVNEMEDFKEDKKVDEGEELKEDKKADEEEELKEDKKLDAGEEIKDGKKDVNLKESEDDNGFQDEKLGEETDVRETMDNKEEKESVEAKKPALDVMEEEDVPEYKDESGEKDKGQEKVEDAPEDKGESGKKEKGLEKEENDKVKVGDKSTEEDIIVEKVSKKRGRGKGNVENGKKKIKEQKGTEGIPEDKDESSEKVESQEEVRDANDKVDYKSKEDDSEDMQVEKGLRRRRRRNIHEEQVKETEARTPASATNRPVRERKSVERLVESYERDLSKEFFIDEGSGMHLKDIPNVAFKLYRRKVDDTLKFLHTILFCRRGKAAEVKKNISRFSGFVWYENEEKQMIKVKEKFDKCNKEKLLDICDVLDIQVAKANTRKEDIIAKLINFLVAPHVTRAVLLEEQEKSVKGRKRKHVTKHGSSRSGTSTSRRSAKSRKKNEDSSDEERKTTTDTESDSEKEDEKGVSDRSEDERPQKSDSEDKNDSESDNESVDVKKMSKINKTFSREKEFAAKGKAKETTFQKKPRTPRKRTSMKSLSTLSESDDDISEGGPKVFSRKKRNEKQKTSTLTKSSSKDNTAEKVTKRKGKNKEKSSPSDDQLRIAICDIFKQVDFNTATFTDILKLLGKQFDKDLTPRKASLMIMIQEELSKQADEDEEGDTENDETHTTDNEVEA